MSQDERFNYLDIENDASYPCWKCSNLIADKFNHQFFCKEGFVLFDAIEPMSGDTGCGTIKDSKRSAINKKTSFLYRLLCCYPQLYVSALPEELKGCLGNLMQFKIVKFFEEAPLARYVTSNQTYVSKKEKVVCLV